MRRFVTVCILVVLTQSTPSTWANSLPETIGYTIYNRGNEVGHSAIHVTETADEIVFVSTTQLRFSDTDSMDVTCRTVADPATYLIRSFEYDGVRGPSEIHAFITVHGDSLHGSVTRNDDVKDDYIKFTNAYNLFLEDYIMEHEILIALAHQARTGGDGSIVDYGLLFPLGMSMSSAQLIFASTVEIESDTKAAVCQKLVINIQGSEPFVNFFDPKRGLPVYLAFPQTSVEVFLDDFFGESPVTRYRD